MSPVAAAQSGDSGAFEELVGGYRRELEAYCYRLLGSTQDAEDALQEAMVAAWRGIASFEGRSSVRTWLYRITTNCAIRQGERRPKRLLSWDAGPARRVSSGLGEPITDPVFIEPWTAELPPDAVAVQRESVRLAYVAALQHLPSTQRAVLVLRDVLSFSAAETATMLATSVAAANSGLQRARATLAGHDLGTTAGYGQLTSDDRERLDAFADAWERADVAGVVELLSADVRFTMPPLPAWFDGIDAVAEFLRERMWEQPWVLRAVVVNDQPGFACYQDRGDGPVLSAVNVLSMHGGQVTWIAGFVDPVLLTRSGLPQTPS